MLCAKFCSTSLRITNGLKSSRAVVLGRPHRSEEHTSELQSHLNLVCRLLLEKKKKQTLLDVTNPVPAEPHAQADRFHHHPPVARGGSTHARLAGRVHSLPAHQQA